MHSVNSFNYPTLLLDFDLNKTIILEESSNGAGWEEMLMSILAENTYYNWEGGDVTSFKDYVYDSLLPGEKSDRALKTKRMEQIANFLPWLVEQDHSMKDKVLADYNEIKDKFTQPGTQEIKTSVF